MDKERIRYLNDKKSTDRPYITYFMQSSQRYEYNHALEYAIKYANLNNKKLIVYFPFIEGFKFSNERMYYFMLEGIKELKDIFFDNGIKFIVEKINPIDGVINIGKISSLIITDYGYTKEELMLRDILAKNLDIPLISVESNVIVPVDEVSLKEEFSARTIRNKILSKLDYYAKDFSISKVIHTSNNDIFDISEFDFDLDSLDLDRSVKKSPIYKGGIKEARRLLDDFINNKIIHYKDLRNNPGTDYQSNLSPYIHFGQISVLEIYLKTIILNQENFIDELIVRRDLAINFVYHNSNYDNYKSLPLWAINTLEKHSNDSREYLYNLEELESYKTHDIYWNKAQEELVRYGKMHGYMRMYWGKKVIEWTSNYKIAYDILVYLNDKYSLDGRDPNGYAGICWCFGKHDRPWQERSIFGNIRYMNKAGLDRKFDMDLYVKKIG